MPSHPDGQGAAGQDSADSPAGVTQYAGGASGAPVPPKGGPPAKDKKKPPADADATLIGPRPGETSAALDSTLPLSKADLSQKTVIPERVGCGPGAGAEGAISPLEATLPTTQPGAKPGSHPAAGFRSEALIGNPPVSGASVPKEPASASDSAAAEAELDGTLPLTKSDLKAGARTPVVPAGSIEATLIGPQHSRLPVGGPGGALTGMEKTVTGSAGSVGYKSDARVGAAPVPGASIIRTGTPPGGKLAEAKTVSPLDGATRLDAKSGSPSPAGSIEATLIGPQPGGAAPGTDKTVVGSAPGSVGRVGQTTAQSASATTAPGSGTPVADQVLLGRYKVVRILGRGAMGEVLRVRDKQSGSDYALKRIPAEMAHDAEVMANIRSNFSLVSQLTHPHIATTRFLESDPETQAAYLIMDFIQGHDLQKWLAEQRQARGAPDAPIPLPVVLGVAEQIASALDYAHSQPIQRSEDGKVTKYGILHRDLKPANAMIEHGREYRPGIPFVKLVDFGLAAEVQASMQSLSIVQKDQSVAGTPAYMSPEQWEGRTLTRGVDQWALAVMIYEMVAGRRPFKAPDITSLAAQVTKAEPEPPPTLTERQWNALKTTFQADRKKRHRSCVALVKALAEADAQTDSSILVAEMPMPDEDVGGTAFTGTRRARRWRGAAVLGVLAVVLVGLGAAWYALKPPPPAPGRSASDDPNVAQINRAIAKGGEALHKYGPELDASVGELQGLADQFGKDYPAEVATVLTQLGNLRQRKKDLETRQSRFNALLDEADGLIAVKPADAESKLNKAREDGKEDPKEGYPDLLAAAKTRLDDLQKRLDLSLEAERKMLFAQNAFKAKYDLALAIDATKEPAKARQQLEEALAGLGAYPHPLKVEAQNKLTALIGRQTKEADYRQLMTAADAARAAGQMQAELDKLKAAQALWPEAPEAPQVAERLQKAEKMLQQQGFAKSLSVAKTAFENHKWTEAKTAFKALVDSAPDPATKKDAQGWLDRAQGRAYIENDRLEDARAVFDKVKTDFPDKASSEYRDAESGIQEVEKREGAASQDRYKAMRTLKLKNAAEAEKLEIWEDALDAYQVLLKANPADDESIKGVSRMNFQIALRDGKKALGAQKWDEAAALFDKALLEDKNSKSAQDGKTKALEGKARAETLTRINKLLEQAQIKAKSENWKGAADDYTSVLNLANLDPAIDPAIRQRATEGRAACAEGALLTTYEQEMRKGQEPLAGAKKAQDSGNDTERVKQAKEALPCFQKALDAARELKDAAKTKAAQEKLKEAESYTSKSWAPF